ncbi:hypothetical protein PQX77_013668 [Marasmius sp. AFHP31]|nr:hypothetical protein PQX77_013668 [Marasmius sp. AFHP31]
MEWYGNGEGTLRVIAGLCPALVECTVVLKRIASDETINRSDPNEWRNLRTLNLRLSASSSGELHAQLFNRYTQGLFRGITSPALEHISLQMVYVEYDAYKMDPLELPFHDLIRRSGCTLATLDLDMWLGTAFMQEIALFDLLEVWGIAARCQWRPESGVEGTLAEPWAIPQSQMGEIAVSLLPSIEGVVACPNLRVARLKDCDPEDVNALAALARARRNTKLKKIKADFGEVLSHEGERIKEIAEQTRECKLELELECEWSTRRSRSPSPHR